MPSWGFTQGIGLRPQPWACSPGFVRGDIRALTDSGLRFVFAYRGTRSSIEDIRRVKRELIDPNPLARLQMGSRLFNQLDVNAMAQLARELGVMLHVHLLENISQRQEGQIAALQTAGALGPSLLVAHAIHLTTRRSASSRRTTCVWRTTRSAT